MFQKRRTYLDWASAAPVSANAELAFVEALRSYGNPSSPHLEGARARELLERARVRIARIAETKPAGVIFTSGATEANNLILQGSVRAFSKEATASKDIHILYLPTAHASVVETLEALAKEGVRIEPLELRGGAIDLDRLKAQLKQQTRLVTLDAVCGESGTRFDTRGVRNVLDAYMREKKSAHIVLHADASQMPLALPWSLTRLSVDALTLDAQKVGGVRGIGALVVRDTVRLESLIHGGGQERGLRSGTESSAHAASFATALEECAEMKEGFAMRAHALRTELVERLRRVPDLQVNAGKENVPNILNLSFVGRDTDYLVMLLDKAGYAVSTRSACESDSQNGSRAVLALTGDPARAKSTLRISWGPSTRPAHLRGFADALTTAVRFLDDA